MALGMDGLSLRLGNSAGGGGSTHGPALLMEDGSFLLLESGDLILLE